MNTYSNYRVSRLVLVKFLLFLSLTGFGQKKQVDTFNIHEASFFLPQPLPGGHYSSSISVLYVVTPQDWTLDNITAPMFSYQGKYTLPKGFNLQAGLASMIISNQVKLGPFWNYKMDNNYIGLGWQVAFDYGILNQFGFATSLTGWEQQPSVTLGHAFNKTAVTIRGELYWTNALYFIEGKNAIPYTTSFINGYSFTASFEQRLFNNRALVFAMKWYYLRYHIIAWPAFPVNQKRYWFPEFQIGINL